MECQVENVVQMGWFCQIKYTFFYYYWGYIFVHDFEVIFPSLLKLPILDGIKLQYGLKFSLEFGNTKFKFSSSKKF